MTNTIQDAVNVTVEHFHEMATTLSPMFNATIDMTANGSQAPAPPGMSPFALQAAYVSNSIVMPIIVVIGILGNILNLVVLSRKSMRSSTSLFLRGLAVADMMLMLCHFPACLGIIPALKVDPNYQLFSRYYGIFRYMFANFCITSTSWITIAVTLERFIAIRYTLKVKLICTTKRAKIAIASIFILSFLFHMSKFFEYEPITDLNDRRPFQLTALGKDATYNQILHYTNISVAVWIPTLFLSIFNILLIYFLVKHNKNKMQLGQDASKKTGEMKRITIVVIAMVFVFIVCHASGVFLAMMIAIHGRMKIIGQHPIYSGLRHISNVMVTLNSCVNFILYCGISKRFREEFMAVFGCCCRKKGQQKSPSSGTSTRSTTSTSLGGRVGSRMHALETKVNNTTRM